MFLKPQTVSELLFKSLRYHANVNMLHLTSNMLNAKKPTVFEDSPYYITSRKKFSFLREICSLAPSLTENLPRKPIA